MNGKVPRNKSFPSAFFRWHSIGDHHNMLISTVTLAEVFLTFLEYVRALVFLITLVQIQGVMNPFTSL